MKIGVFDSGIGGTTVLAALKELLPNENYRYIADSENCPYGEKSDEELRRIVTTNVEKLKAWGAKIIFIACNTATTRCIDHLRQQYPEIIFIGTEPAIKLAAKTDVKNILVLATPGTITSERTKVLLEENKKPGQNITLLSCPGLADTIEKYLTTDSSKIVDKLTELLTGVSVPDIVVLGCTHYSLIKDLIQDFFPNAKLLDGNFSIACRLKQLLDTIS